MDKDLLRRQIVDEIQAEFDTKLRQAKRQKEQAEGELEAASERWRAEKRRMNAEIDRLEAALVDAKAAAARKQPQSDSGRKPSSPDPLAVARIQEAADEKLKKATAEWERERGQLKSQINRLEGAVAEAIARASNPLRSTQPMKEQFEIELNRVAQEKTEIEQAFLRAKTQWEQEKLKITGEMVKLRRAAQIMGQPLPKEDKPDVNPKTRDLENQLKESHAKWSAEREQLAKEIHRLEQVARHWDIERRQRNDHAGQLQSANALLEAERTPRSAMQTENSGFDNTAIEDEVSRVESLIKEVVALMDDPDTELSTIIRKNVEKAELDAYLKGIMFAFDRSK